MSAVEIRSCRPPVHERLQIARLAWRLERSNIRGRRGSHHGEESLDRLQHAGHAAECQRSGAEAGDFTIGRMLETPHKMNGVCRGIDAVE